MGIFDKFKKKNEVVEQKEDQVINDEDSKGNYSLVEMNNYMLSDVRKESLSNNTYSLSLSKLSEISPITVSTANNIKTIMEQNPKTSGNLYRITNLGKNDSLKAMRDGKTFWGSIKKSDGSSTMAKLKEVSERCYNKEPKYVIVDVATGILISYARSKKRCLEKYEDIRTKYYEFKQTNQYEKCVIQFKSLTTTI